MFLFVYRDFYVGGCEFLIEKIGSALVKSGERVCIFCKTMDSLMRERYLNKKIEILMLPDWSRLKTEVEQFDCQGPLNIIAFLWRSFYPCYLANRKDKKTVFYAVNSEAYKKDITDSKFLAGKSKEYCAAIVGKFIKRGNFIAMDEVTLRCTQEFYGRALRIKKEDCTVIFISVDMSGVEPVSKEQVIHNFRKPRILTISRADFSMKGYLIGLLDWFSKTEIEEVCLDIVTYGPDEDAVKEMACRLPQDKKNRLRLYGKTDYDELDGIIKNSIVYVGMGTTVLDAAERGIISVPVAPFTDKLSTSGFFAEHYDYLGAVGSGRGFEELVKDVLMMSADEYMVNSKAGVEMVSEHYELNRNTSRIQNHFSAMPDDNVEEV